MIIKRFEEIEAWQKTRQLTAKIYKDASRLIGGFMRYPAPN